MSPCCLIGYDADLGEACIEILDVLSPVPALPKLLLTRAHHLTIRNGLVIWTRSNGAPWVLLWRLGPFYDQRSPSEGIFTYDTLSASVVKSFPKRYQNSDALQDPHRNF